MSIHPCTLPRSKTTPPLPLHLTPWCVSSSVFGRCGYRQVNSLRTNGLVDVQCEGISQMLFDYTGLPIYWPGVCIHSRGHAGQICYYLDFYYRSFQSESKGSYRGGEGKNESTQKLLFEHLEPHFTDCRAMPPGAGQCRFALSLPDLPYPLSDCLVGSGPLKIPLP